MTTQRQKDRRAAIEAAAYDVLQEKGYAGASMLAVARSAKASNQTLYKWYGDKTGLYATLIAGNAQNVRDLLDSSESDAPLETLQRLGRALYELLTSDRAIALNRAAAADPSGELGQTLGKTGRETIGPLIGRLFHRLRAEGHITFGTTAEAVALYLDLLVGDHQIRRAIGTMPTPGPAAIAARAETATQRFLVLLSPEVYPGHQPKPTA